MTNQKIIINNVEVDKAEIVDLINQDKPIEAIKFVYEKTGLGLKDSKYFVENLYREIKGEDSLPLQGSDNSVSVNIGKIKDKITVTFTDNDGKKVTVTPQDALWNKVKEVVGNNPMLAEYEKSYYSSVNNNPSQDSPFIEHKKRNNTLIYALIAVGLVLIATYYFISN